jgi:two-component system sensor histidine kinase YesM
MERKKGLLSRLWAVAGNLSLRAKLVAFCLVTILASQGITGLTSYYQSSEMVRSKVGYQIRQSLNYVDNHIQSVMNNVNWVSNAVFSNRIIQDQLRNYKYEELRPIAGAKEINTILLNLAISIDNINYISINGYNGENYIYGNAVNLPIEYIVAMPWYDLAVRMDGRQLWVNMYTENPMSTEPDKSVFNNVRILKDFQKGENVGILVVSLKETVLSDVYSNLSDTTGYIMILSEEGTVLSSIDKGRIGQDIRAEQYFTRLKAGENAFGALVDGEQCLVNWIPSKNADWIIIDFTPMRHIGNEVIQIAGTILIVAALCFVLAMAVVAGFTMSVTTPLSRLGELMEQAEGGNLSVRAEASAGQDEVSRLSRRFNTMLARIQLLIEEVSTARTDKREAEFRALRAQINPHFLYNTLESINSMAKIDGSTEISRMVITLSKILRNSINLQKSLVTVRYELEQLENYLTIQQIRYENKYTYSLDIAPELLERTVLSFILQPLVENAIYHGIELKEGRGCLKIAGRLTLSGMQFCVSDDGVGIPPGRLEEIRQRLEQRGNPDREDESYGVYNVQNRIRLTFGESYGLAFDSIEGLGTKVYVNLPVLEEKRNV